MHSQASVISALRNNLSGWTVSIIKPWSAAGLSHYHAPVRMALHRHSRFTTSLRVQRCPRQLSGFVVCDKHSSVRVCSSNDYCLTKQGLSTGEEDDGSRSGRPIHSQNCLQAEKAGTMLRSHQLGWFANARNSRAVSRPPTARATTVDEALSTRSDKEHFRNARNSLERNHHSLESISPLSDWVIEWQTSEMARWLSARGENWLLVEGPMLPRDHPTLGRGLFTSRAVRRGESLVEVSRGLIATPQSLPEELRDALPEEVTDWGRMAVFLVLERRRGGESEWAPYVQAMPPLENLDSTVFWSNAELALLRGSNLADVTRERRRMMADEYDALRPVMQSRPGLFDSVPLSESEFQHGYALVCSRAWMIEDLDHISMIPFVDFFNHDGGSISHLSYDKDAGLAYIDADRDYDPGEQVLISYGDAPNATLALDFGFTLAENPHDQVAVWMPLPAADPLKPRKAELLRAHDFDLQATTGGDPNGGAWFTLKESKSGAAGRGEGIPRRLQAFQRVVSATSAELDQMEATTGRGKPLASRGSLTASREAEALLALLVRLEDLCDTCREQEARLAELLLGWETSGNGLLGNDGLKAESLDFDKDVDAGALGLQNTFAGEGRENKDLCSSGRGYGDESDGPEPAKSSESLEHVLSGDSVLFGGEVVMRRRVQMAYDVLRGEARVLRSAVAWLRPRSAGGGFEQLLYGERGLASVAR